MAATMLASSRKLSLNLSKSVPVSRRLLRNETELCKNKLCQRRGLSSFRHGTKASNLQMRKVTNGQPFITFTQARGFRLTACSYDEFVMVSTPTFPDSISEGDVQWAKEVGDSVEVDEQIGEVETDKTSIPVMCPANGVIEAILVESGEKIVPGQEILKIKVGAVGAAPSKPATEETKAEPAPEPKADAASAPAPATPPQVPPKPTAPMSSTPTSQIKATPATPASKSSDTPSVGTRSEKRVKMNRMRLKIAQRLKDAQNECAMLTTFNEIDMSNIMELRTKYKDAFLKKHNIKLGFMSAFLKASAAALQDQPAVNAVIDMNEIVYRDYVDISVAVATPKGLVVPVLRNVETMNYADIEMGLNALGEKARDGDLAIEDMDGGTFTISNGGVFGSLMGTPIINPPQSAILGMHGIFDRPVAIKGQVEIRPMMYVALTYDHRLVDGREAVTFLRKIKSTVEDPRTLLLDL